MLQVLVSALPHQLCVGSHGRRRASAGQPCCHPGSAQPPAHLPPPAAGWSISCFQGVAALCRWALPPPGSLQFAGAPLGDACLTGLRALVRRRSLSMASSCPTGCRSCWRRPPPRWGDARYLPPRQRRGGGSAVRFYNPQGCCAAMLGRHRLAVFSTFSDYARRPPHGAGRAAARLLPAQRCCAAPTQRRARAAPPCRDDTIATAVGSFLLLIFSERAPRAPLSCRPCPSVLQMHGGRGQPGLCPAPAACAGRGGDRPRPPALPRAPQLTFPGLFSTPATSRPGGTKASLLPRARRTAACGRPDGWRAEQLSGSRANSVPCRFLAQPLLMGRERSCGGGGSAVRCCSVGQQRTP